MTETAAVISPTVLAAPSAQLQADRQAQENKDNTARMFEARKPFNQKQLDLYMETAQVAGRLVSAGQGDIPGSQWAADVRRFEQLYWTELSMVEDEDVKRAMQNFRPILLKIRARNSFSQDDQLALQDSSYRLAKALNVSIASTWVVALSEVRELEMNICVGDPDALRQWCRQPSERPRARFPHARRVRLGD